MAWGLSASCVAIGCFASPAGAAAVGCGAPSFDPYGVSQATLQSCGLTTYPRIGEAPLSDGGTSYTYGVPGGTVRVPVPPSSFDALTASSSERALYGIPSSPPGGSASVFEWDEVLGKLHVPPAPPYLVGVPTRGTTTVAYSSNWSGYVDTNPPSPPASGYNEATISFTMPTDTGGSGSGCSGTKATYIWAGLGGYGSNNLLQDGFSIGASGLGENRGWWESLGAGPNTPALAAPIYASTGYGATADTTYVVGSPNGEADFTLINNHTGAYWWAAETGLSADFSGSSADFVTERPGVPSLALEQFTPFTASGTANESGDPNGIGYYDNQQVVMTNSADTQTLAYPSSLSGALNGTFTESATGTCS